MKTVNIYFKISFLMLLLGFSLHCFATQDPKVSYNNAPNNYYTQPDKVYMDHNGIFVLLEGELFQVNMLCTDEGGIFVPAHAIGRQMVRCSFCGRWYDPDYYHNCKGP